MTEIENSNSHRIDGSSEQIRYHRPSSPSSTEAPTWQAATMASRSRSAQRDGTDPSQKRLSITTTSSDYDHLTRSPVLEHEHPPGPSGLLRIRQQPQSRAFSLPAGSLSANASAHGTAAPSPTTASSRTGTTHLPQSADSICLEDLHRFPSESLHSFSFAQQSEELLHTRHNVLKRSIDFMKDRLGWAEADIAGAGPSDPEGRTKDAAELQGVVDFVSKTNLLGSGGAGEENTYRPEGPATGPAQVERGNVFDASFAAYQSTSPTSYASQLPSKEAPNETTGQNQFLSPRGNTLQEPNPQSTPSSRRVSLRRTYTELGSPGLPGNLVDTLSQPYSLSGLLSPSYGGPASAVHTHSSKWSPAPQAVFRTDAKPNWTILAANDLACLVFGITQKEFRKLSVLDLVQEERRGWLEAKLADVPFEAPAPRQQSPEKPKTPSRFPGMGKGVTAQLLSKPPSREKAGHISQTTDNYGRPRQPKSPNHHPATESRGVLLCGDVVPIQKRNGTTGSASLWVMEKRGGFIWVVEEIVENTAQAQFDPAGGVVEAQGDIESIWGRQTIGQETSIFDLLPHMPKRTTPPSPDFPKRGDTMYLTAMTQAGMEIPVTVEPTKNMHELRVCSFPNIAGVTVVSSKSLEIISANPVFSAALFGRNRPEGSKITDLIPDFDTYLSILTEEDNVPLTNGMVIPEHSFRRARALSILREGKVNVATLFMQPTGLPARHSDGGSIMVDVQMRVVKNEPLAPGDQMPTVGEHEELEHGNGSPAPVPEAAFALWVTYSRQLHSSNPYGPGQSSIPKTQTHPPVATQPPPQEPTPSLHVSSPSRSSILENKPQMSLLTQKLNEAASEPLTDKPAQPVPEVKASAGKKDVPKKKTVSDYVILEDMGQGAYGQVKLARSKRDPNKTVVLKYVTKKRILVDTWTRDRRLGTVPLEIHVLDYLSREHLKHPSIVEMEGFFEDDVNYYIEMTPHGLPGMDLFDYVELRSNMTEAECRNIFRQVVGAIHHLHTKALVVHRDIKDENVVLDGEGRIKLIDFGSAAYIKNGPFDVFVGTIDYAAPEVLQGRPYRGKEQDVWALGILLYTIIYKENPFYNINEIMDHPLRIPFLPFSEDCIDLIRKMLDRDVDERLAITEVMTHPWMQATTNGTGQAG